MEYQDGFAYAADLKTTLIKAINEAGVMCNITSSNVLGRSDIAQRINQMRLLRDASEACVSTAIIVAYNSEYIKEQIDLCATFLNRCGIECLKFQDIQSQQCGRICLQAAKMCKNYINL